MNSSLLWLPLAVGSAFFAALVAIFGKMGVSKVDTVTATTARAAVMFTMLLIIALATGGAWKLGTITGKTGLYVILAGVAGALSWLCYFWALKVGKIAQVAPIDRFSAVLAIALAFVLLGENVSWRAGVGALIMTLGAIFVALG